MDAYAWNCPVASTGLRASVRPVSSLVKTNRLKLLAAAWLLAIAFVSLARAAEALATHTWTVNGVSRQALIHAPARARTEVVPVVFAFHGHGGGMVQASRSFGLHTLWPEAIVVYMQGLPTSGMTDPDGKQPGWQKAPGDYGDRDLAFFDQVLATLQKDYRVDPKRIYAMGHSNGGQFTYLLWAMRGETLAAVGPSAAAPGLLWVNRLKPKPALHVAGENDELVKFTVQRRAMEAVRRLNGCAPEGQPWDKSGPITGTRYASSGGTPFVSLIHPGTHKYPPEAPALIVKFFKEQAQP